MSERLKIRPRPPAVRAVWTTGWLYAGVLVFAGLASWVFDAEPVASPLLVYGIAAAVVLVLSRGLYNRSIVSGLMLLGGALGPSVRGVFDRAMGVAPETGPAGLVVEGGVALAGLGFGAHIIWALRALWRGEAA